MPTKFNVDIHCHPSGKPYMSGRAHQQHSPFESYNNEIQGWLLNRLNRQIENLSHIRLATQSNFDNLHAGNVRVVIASITPLERAFLVVNQKAGSFLNDTIKDLVTEKKTPWEDTVKSKVVNALTGFYVDDIDFIKKSILHYFREGFLPEYNYFTSFHDKESAAGGYKIKFVKNYQEIEDIMNAGSNTICVVLSIEGAHALAKEVPNLGHLRRMQGISHKNDPANFTALGDYVNNIEKLKKLDFVPLFVTFNHHFWNGLGGHARSLMKLVGTFVSQDEGLNEGLKEIGKEVINYLLRTDNGPRVLIDIKHMSPLCRKEFYAFIETKYWKKNDLFPVICSHTGVVSKSRTLQNLMMQDDNAELHNNSNYLHENSINLCAEDVLVIAKTNGLIGIQLDEKRIAGNDIIDVIKQDESKSSQELRMQYVKVLFANLFEIVKTVNSKKGWDIISIGSDYDGLINHLDFYPTTADMPSLREDMLQFLLNPVEISQPGFNYSVPLAQINKLMFGLDAGVIIDKVFADNAMNFLKLNFNR